MPPLFERRPGGELRLRLHEHEAELLAALAGELATLLVDEERGAREIVDRLFPRAYLDPTEEEAEATWQEAVHPDLVSQRLSALLALASGLADAPRDGGWVEVTLDDAAAERWLLCVNDLRLVLGTRLGVEEDTDFAALDPDDPASEPFFVYGWLTVLAGSAVDALTGDDFRIPPPDDA